MTPELKRLIDRRLNRNFKNSARRKVTRICVLLSDNNSEIREACLAEAAGEIELLRTFKNKEIYYQMYGVKQE